MLNDVSPNIYNQHIKNEVALTKLAHWYNKVEKPNIRFFKSVVETIVQLLSITLNEEPLTPPAESFNAKIKVFRAQFRGVRDIPFSIFRLTKIFA